MWEKIRSFFRARIGNPQLIIIRGAPSSGKTTVAHELSQRLSRSVRISIDYFVLMNVPVEHTNKEWIDARPAGHKLARILIDQLLQKGTTVIVEEAFPETEFIQRIEKIAKSRGLKSFVFELKTQLPVALEREKKRSYAKEGKPVREIMELIDKNPYPGAVKIDTSKKTPEQIVAVMLDTLST